MAHWIAVKKRNKQRINEKHKGALVESGCSSGLALLDLLSPAACPGQKEHWRKNLTKPIVVATQLSCCVYFCVCWWLWNAGSPLDQKRTHWSDDDNNTDDVCGEYLAYCGVMGPLDVNATAASEAQWKRINGERKPLPSNWVNSAHWWLLWLWC